MEKSEVKSLDSLPFEKEQDSIEEMILNISPGKHRHLCITN